MSTEEDRESRTEDPTEKRLSDAIEKGNVPMAREATLFGSIAGTYVALALLGGWMVAGIAMVLQGALESAGTLRLDDREAAGSLLISLVFGVGAPLMPVVAIIAAGSLTASMLQNVPTFSSERITPKASRISPAGGWMRLFGHSGWFEFFRAFAKLSAVCAILWITFRKALGHFAALLMIEPGMLPLQVRDMSSRAMAPLLALALVLAIADLVWSRFRWRRDLRMSRQEVKEEMREAEGDPLIKFRIRNIARQRSSRRMLEHIPRATMVITNPTHFAVALRYQREEGGAPVVVAKGVDHLAQRIREIATEHEVPLVENRPLARSLYTQVEIDAQIPPEFYRAIAEIIHYLNSAGRLPRSRRPI